MPIFLIDESHRQRGLAEVLDFREVARAHEIVESGRTVGNVVLRL